MSYTTEPAPQDVAAVTVVDDHRRYAAASSEFGGIYHHPGWREAFATYGLKSWWLVATAGGRPAGVMPLVRQSSRVFGARLTSLPWVDEAGAVGSPEAVRQLLSHAVALARSEGARFEVVTKQPTTCAAAPPAGWGVDGADKVLARLRLPAGADALWSGLSAKVRNQVRKSQKSGVEVDRGGAELVGAFYKIYSQNMRDLGSPSHSRAFFEELCGALGDAAAVYVARAAGEPVGAGLVLANGDAADIPWASSLRASNSLCVNHGLYWRVLADAADDGRAWFRFGRSTRDSGQHRFKRQWGAQDAPLAWFRHGRVADDDGSPADAPSRALDAAQQVWRRLPLSVSRRLGPLIVSNAP
ncbi:GNAT family N-acetyltransferase [Botrimarina sp.]|uniref:GNAT family N-acetyltransferase n=1 Tax=Botrimarina sp. TaxID=2795802 RepID=UPI0032F00EF5